MENTIEQLGNCSVSASHLEQASEFWGDEDGTPCLLLFGTQNRIIMPF
jgi:hypothetical protein